MHWRIKTASMFWQRRPANQLETLNTMGPAEAASTAKVLTSGLSEKLAELNGTIGASMQMIKGAQTTPPESGQ